MIIDLHEKLDVNAEWFAAEAVRDAKEAWSVRLCELLSVYRVKDKAGAKEAAEKLKAAGVSEELIIRAME